MFVHADKARSDRSVTNADTYEETRSTSELVQWVFRMCKSAHEKAQRWANASATSSGSTSGRKGKISLTFIVSDESGHSVQFMSSGVASAPRIERLKQAHMWTTAAATGPATSATSAATSAATSESSDTVASATAGASATAPTTSSLVPLTKKEKNIAPPEKWSKRDRETLVALFRRKTEMKEFFDKVHIRSASLVILRRCDEIVSASLPPSLPLLAQEKVFDVRHSSSGSVANLATRVIRAAGRSEIQLISSSHAANDAQRVLFVKLGYLARLDECASLASFFYRTCCYFYVLEPVDACFFHYY